MRFGIPVLAIIAAAALSIADSSPATAATRLVLFEEATQWNCPPCASLNPLFEAWLKQQEGQALCIRYHAWWPGSNNDPMYLFDKADHDTRIKYYSVDAKGVPCTEINGGNEHVGYNSTYITQFQHALDSTLARESPLTLAVTQSVDGPTATVTVTASSTVNLLPRNDLFGYRYMLRIAIVEPLVSDIGYGTNGESQWENVVRKMLPNAGGTSISLPAGQSKTFSFTYNVADIPDQENCFVVAWVQFDATHEVINAAVNSAPSGVRGSRAALDFQVEQNYPNPASSSTAFTFDIPRSERVTIQVFDTKGALVATALDELRAPGPQSVSFDVGALPAGSYEYRMTTPSGSRTRSMTVWKSPVIKQ